MAINWRNVRHDLFWPESRYTRQLNPGDILSRPVLYSPYPEVRSTMRVYLLAIIWTIIGAGIRQFFSPRQPSISLGSTVIQLFLYPCGRLLELLPDWGFTIRGKRYSINPGPWTFKKMLATIMINVAVGGAYVALYNIIVQKLPMYYGNTWATPRYQFLLILSTQFLGFGFAGVLRRWVVYPTKALWPTILPSIALSRALLKPDRPENIHGWTISRYWFFLVCCTASFLYFWFPNYLFQALSTFNWITWIAPNNFNLALITGTVLGLGLNPWPTFDWNVAASLTAPLVTPFYSLKSNYKYTAYLPLNTNALRANTNKAYAVTEILTNGLLDEKKYQQYSPPFYSAGDLMVYGVNFCFYPASILWAFINEGRTIVVNLKEFVTDLKNRQRSNYDRFDDPFSRMMRKHKEVPDWLFLIVLVISFVLCVVCLTVYPTNTPAYEYNIDGRAESYISDQKLPKIPARAVFRGQILTSLIQAIVSIGVVNWQIGNIPDLCNPLNTQKFTCPGPQTYYSASIGELLRYLPKYFRYVNPVLVIGGMSNWAPYNLSYLTGGFYLSIFFMFFVRRRYLAWWEKYNYVLSSAMDAGIAFSAIIIFFAVDYHAKNLRWWGNTVSHAGIDGGVENQVQLELPAIGYFGSKPGEYP
ncbi:OPT oligopeptide transporter protein-domain-containing protein [Lipomyces kononenkoae]